jgi:two-component system, NarL family, nitrate/nitrite response regulator NarL
MNTIQDITKIMIVDDHPLFRKGLAQLLNDQADFEVMLEASGGDEALDLLIDNEPDLIILDLNMRGRDGLSTLQMMREREITSRILMLTVSDAQNDVLSCLRAGADGYLLKDLDPQELLKQIRESANGSVVVDPRLASALANAVRERTNPQTGVASLTDREQQIVKLIANGMSNKMIARHFDIVESTVKVHVKHLLKKLGLRSRVEAAIWAIENNLK